MRLALATGTGPMEWGLPIDWDIMNTFELELELQTRAIENAKG